MRIAGGIVSGGGENAVAVETLGDRMQSGSGAVLVEDALDHWGGDRVELESAEPLPVCRLRWIRVNCLVGNFSKTPFNDNSDKIGLGESFMYILI